MVPLEKAAAQAALAGRAGAVGSGLLPGSVLLPPGPAWHQPSGCRLLAGTTGPSIHIVADPSLQTRSQLSPGVGSARELQAQRAAYLSGQWWVE